ncbi:ankyrin repeat domain-containing protein 31 isoform X2 [Pseudophryne corroboree]|uniref:ankyrin repeat domain-containing protein 31 isoform X2 n=1 Tax=Pseudophryne corroboree TaxID=495146 RepID=UPI00308177FB
MVDGKNEVRQSRASRKTATVKKHMPNKILGNINKRNFMGETKLHQASKKGDLQLVNALIEAGIDVNQKDNAGWAAIHEASCRGYTEIILALLQAGADVNSKGLDGILPIHDAVFSNCFKAVELLLEFGADPYERDTNQENAFDKCCSDKMTELLKPHSAVKETTAISATPGTETQPKIVSSTQNYKTREKCAMETLATLQETERRQTKLLSTELQTSKDSEKYIEEMRCIQDVLNKIVILQKNERDILAKKYRASVDSFRQGILRDKIAKLATRQKVLLRVVGNQKEVALRIMAYQQAKRSDADNGEKSSSLRDWDTAPRRNPIAALCAANERLNANIANGSTMVTNMPAVCRVAHSESNQSHRSLMRDISSSVSSDAMVSERTVQQSSIMSSNQVPVSTESGLFSSISPRKSHEEANDHLECTAPGSNSPNPISINDTLNITDKININVKTIKHQIRAEMHQTALAGQHLQRPNCEEATFQAVMSGSSMLGGVSGNGKPQNPVTRHRRTSWEQCINPYAEGKRSPKRQQRYVAAERKIRKVPMKTLIKTGKLKPGDDVLCFQLQDYSHKASLLPDGRIKDCSGAMYRDPAQWVKALLGSNIAVNWKYVANKVTYLGEKLTSLMKQEDFAPKKCNHYALQDQTNVLQQHQAHTGLQHPSAHTGLQHPSAHTGLQHPSAHTGLQHPSAHTGLQHPSAHTGLQQQPAPQELSACTVLQQCPAHTVLQERSAHTVIQERPAHTVIQETPAHTVLQECAAHTVLQERSACTALQVKEILLIDKSEYFPSHIMDQYWEEFMTSDSQDL